MGRGGALGAGVVLNRKYRYSRRQSPAAPPTVNNGTVFATQHSEVRLARSKVDVVGLGLNATDTVMTVRKIPALGGKERVVASSMQAGGQMATALVACRRLGLKVRYIGKVGDDPAGRMQIASLRREGLDLLDTKVVRGAPNQYGCIFVDQATGERTVFWDRDPRLAVRPRDFKASAVTTARLLHLDGCDVEASLAAARWARRAGIPVTADLDTVYEKVEKLFPCLDYLIASTQLLPAVTGHADPFKALESMAREHGVATPGMTLGRDGALVYHAGRFCYSPGFVVDTVDTTGAGDVFHGAFAYAILKGWDMPLALDFSNAMAALNCTALGARGGIKSRAEAEHLMATGRRHVNPAFVRG
jgi:sulfofructose kinase